MHTFEEIRALIIGCSTIYVEFQICTGHYMYAEVDKGHLIRQLSMSNDSWQENKDEGEDDEIFEAKVKGSTLYVGVCQL